MFGAATIARKAKLARAALSCQRGLFVLAKGDLPITPQHFAQGRLTNLSKLVVWVNVVITRIQATIMLKGKTVAAGLGKNTQCRGLSHPETELHIKEQHRDAPHIGFEP